MTRQNALLRLQKNLLARRDRLGKKLAGELAYLHDGQAGDASGDSADLAFEADGDEMSSRLAELDARELSQIERAVARWQHGRYGLCESCQKPVSLDRLNALPYAPLCINCERGLEKTSAGQDRQSRGNWGEIADAQTAMQDPRINLSELERDLTASH
jgi:DnaK suppressor protein